MLHILHYLEAIVTCNETTIKVEVEKSYLIRRNEDNLHLNDFTDPACNLTRLSNTTHLVAVMSLNTCGTLVEVQHTKQYGGSRPLIIGNICVMLSSVMNSMSEMLKEVQ